MNGSARQPTAGSHIARPPYAAPQQDDVLHSAAPGTDQLLKALPEPRFGGGGSRTFGLAPFIPAAFRRAAHLTAAFGDSSPQSTLVATRFPDGPPTSNERASSLPWIDAFAIDSAEGASEMESNSSASDDEPSVIEPGRQTHDPGIEGGAEDSWMLGEAGKRLDELTQSLSSLDQSRSSAPNSKAGTPRNAEGDSAILPMWGDDEWMDIMPSPAVAALMGPSPQHLVMLHEPEPAEAPYTSEAQRALEEAAAEALEAQMRHCETAATVLESVARRIRGGDVPVPDFEPGLGDVAVLAGILASLLRNGR